MVEISEFDASAFLDDEEVISQYSLGMKFTFSAA